MWTLVSGTGTITTPTSPTSGITGLGLGANVFKWTISSPPCASTSDQVTINNTGGGPIVNITAHTNVSCYGGNNGTASASATGGIGNLTYSWTGGGGNAAVANNLTAGTFTVTATDSIGCTGFATIQITQPTDSISAVVNTTPTACGSITGSATIIASGGTGNLTFSWSNGGATTSTINNIGAGIHSVTITDSLGCTKTVSGTVGITGSLTATTTAQTNVSCYGGNNGNATASVSGGVGTLTYLWTGGGGSAATANNLAAGTYTVTITDGSGCSGTKVITITQPDSISAIINTTPTACGTNNGSANVIAHGGTGNLTYLWSNGGATTSTITNLGAGTYSAAVTDSAGCTKTVSGMVAITAAPIANAGPDVTIKSDSTTHLSASGGGTYSWTPPTGLSCTNCQKPYASPVVTTTYYLTVIDSNGCSSVDTVIVTVVPFFIIPNVFSPNNDGVNDLFEIRADGYKDYHVEIYNRWGQKLFETTDSKVYWDGLIMGGAKASDGIYYYILSLTDNTDAVKTYKGFLSLIR